MSKMQKMVHGMKIGIIYYWGPALTFIWIFCVKNVAVLVLDILLTVLLSGVTVKIFRILEKIHLEKEGQSGSDAVKLVKKRLLILMPLGCGLVILLVFINWFISFGSSIEDAYCKKYNFFKENELNILYQQNMGNDELVILSEDSQIAYCLFEKFEMGNGTYYKIRRTYKVYKVDKAPFYYDYESQIKNMSRTEEEETFLKESNEESQISDIIRMFYKKDKIFYQDDFQMIGVSYNSFVDQIKVAGQKVYIIQISELDGIPIYLWKADHVDLENADAWDVENIGQEQIEDIDEEIKECIMPQKLLGEWRVSRIILLPKVWRNDLIISYNYGRTITITESEIVDSLDTSTMGSNDWDYSMHGLYGIEVMKADSAEFAMSYNAYLFDLGLSTEQLEKVTVMGYWNHAAERGLSEDGKLEFFLLDDDTMIKQFNSGIYLLKKQNTEAVETLDVETLYGNYKVTEMVSRDIPTSESGATEFFGRSFYWDENGIYDVREQKYILSGAAQLETTDMDKFYENHVVETGLGLTNDRILIWEQGSETVIPINTEEVIVKLRGGWYRMVKTDLLEESTDGVHVLSDSLWKPQQILSYTEGTEEEIKEAARSAEYLLAKWVYISEEDVENFDLQTGSTEEIEKTYHMLDGFGNRGDGLAYFLDENTGNIYLVLSEDKIISRIDDVWYYMTKIEENE